MRESFSIWWFAGVLLLAYGVVILTTGDLGSESSSAPSSGAQQSSCADLVGRAAHGGGPGLHHRLSSPAIG